MQWKIFVDFFLNYTGIRRIRYTVNEIDEHNDNTNLLMDDFDDTFDSFGDDDEEELYDIVEQRNANRSNYDPVTKKKAVPQVMRENLYLPGKIMHIQYKKRRNW